MSTETTSTVYRVSVAGTGREGVVFYTEKATRMQLEGRPMVKFHTVYLEDDGSWRDTLAEAQLRAADQFDAIAGRVRDQAEQLRKAAAEVPA
jgi:hypothetical protein